MDKSLTNNLFSMLSGMDEKKLSEGMSKAMEVLKKHDINEIKTAIANNDLSKILDGQGSMDIAMLINALPDSKKLALSKKFESPEVQDALKTDKNKALEILMQTVLS